MKNDEIKRLVTWLQGRVNLAEDRETIEIVFDEPGAGDFSALGFGPEVVAMTLERDWWPEMAEDITETPDFAEPDESPEQVLGYARDVVSEHVGKRLGT